MAALAPLTRKRLLGTSYGLGSGSYTSRRQESGCPKHKGSFEVTGNLEIGDGGRRGFKLGSGSLRMLRH